MDKPMPPAPCLGPPKIVLSNKLYLQLLNAWNMAIIDWRWE